MVGTERLSRGAKLKLTWLVTALVVVWMSGPGVVGGGRPAAATVAVGSVPDLAAPALPGEPAGLEVRLARGRVAEASGVRLGVLAVADELMSSAAGVQKGSRLISVYVALKNVGARGVTYTALDLELRDDRGRYPSLEARRGPGPMLTFGSLAQGEAATGWRMFRVPAEAGPLRLALSSHLSALSPGS